MAEDRSGSRRPSSRETWRAPAKINLWLEILGRRDDGHHLVDTAYQAIDLADTVVLEPPSAAEAPVSCRVVGEYAEDVPSGEGNLAVRAARRLAERTGHDLRLALTLEKAIPAGAGLGGGSSDAAAVLVALAARFAVPDPRHGLHDLAASLGADVPFFLAGGTRIGRGIGADLAPAEPPAERWGVVVWPGVPVSTAVAYRAWDAAAARPAARAPDDGAVPREGAAARGPAAPSAVGWRERRNDLEAVVSERHPEVARAREILAAGPAAGVRMSGSGGAVFALYAEPAARDADLPRVREAAAELPGARAWPFALVDHGVLRVG